MSEFYDNEFERFLQQQVKQHRMYPSDAVWKGIYKQIHGDKKWPGLYFIAILLIALVTVCTVFLDRSPSIVSAKQQTALAKADIPVFNIDPVAVTHETYVDLQQSKPQPMVTVPTQLAVDETQNPSYNLNTDVSARTISMNAVAPSSIASATEPIIVQESTSSPITVKQSEQTTALAATNTTTAIDTKIDNKQAEEAQPSLETQVPVVINKGKQNRWRYEVYITPATTFKHTVDRQSAKEQFNGPVTPTVGLDANKIIRYKPGMGTEFGLGVLYDVSNRLTVKTGVQYNVRQYNIEAYDGGYEVSTINNTPTLAKYRSTYNPIYNEALLLNKYHQVSFPLGVEYALLKRNRIAFKLGGSVQPTYTFSQSAYLLTSDYKSYADGTSMIRKWNINSSLEATLNFTVGDFQWKLGPQFRYQLLSTFSDKYPIKEYLIDYGFKIGFTKTIR